MCSEVPYNIAVSVLGHSEVKKDSILNRTF